MTFSLHLANDPGLFQREVAPQPELNGWSSVKHSTPCLAGGLLVKQVCYSPRLHPTLKLLAS